ncbi:hypothetical protein [Stieleria mannarensis]|nr:hypothetical protein [Rhodopirellula sp. JC639]
MRESSPIQEVDRVTIDYTFGHDEIAQRIVTDDGNGGTTDETHGVRSA